jgi:uncharacterized protein (TIGR00730 family)
VRVCVYCASSAASPVAYRDAAYELGRLLAQSGITTIFGGGGSGSMGRLADGVLDAGGEIIGIMPRFMKELEWAHPGVSNYIWTDDLADRKRHMLQNSDALVALPGGCGTFEELLEAITLKRLGLFLNPVVIVNQLGFYDSLLALLQRSVQDRFMDERHLNMFVPVAQVNEVLDAIYASPPWSSAARAFATKIRGE